MPLPIASRRHSGALWRRSRRRHRAGAPSRPRCSPCSERSCIPARSSTTARRTSRCPRASVEPMSPDFLIIGGGIAGASAGYFLAERGRVLVLEREDSLGYHSTGRSAALYTETYGNAAIRALTVCSGPFFRNPPAGFTEHPLLTPRGVLIAAPPESEAKFKAALAEAQRFTPTVRALSQSEALPFCPVLRPDWFRFAFHEPD